MTEEEQLTLALYIVLVELHPMYGSTAGRYGGIGGQAITAHCSINYPDRHDLKDYTARDWAEGVLRAAINRNPDFDIAAQVERLLPKEG